MLLRRYRLSTVSHRCGSEFECPFSPVACDGAGAARGTAKRISTVVPSICAPRLRDCVLRWPWFLMNGRCRMQTWTRRVLFATHRQVRALAASFSLFLLISPPGSASQAEGGSQIVRGGVPLPRGELIEKFGPASSPSSESSTIIPESVEKLNSDPSRARKGAVSFGAQEPLPYGRGSERASHTPSK